jgi:hypothetical protein
MYTLASYNGLRTIDVDKLKFRYSWMDIQAAAKAKVGKRKDFIKPRKKYTQILLFGLKILLTLTEPMHNDYFWHKAYGDYPVVSKMDASKSFCAWRTKTVILNQRRKVMI